MSVFSTFTQGCEFLPTFSNFMEVKNALLLMELLVCKSGAHTTTGDLWAVDFCSGYEVDEDISMLVHRSASGLIHLPPAR